MYDSFLPIHFMGMCCIRTKVARGAPKAAAVPQPAQPAEQEEPAQPRVPSAAHTARWEFATCQSEITFFFPNRKLVHTCSF